MNWKRLSAYIVSLSMLLSYFAKIWWYEIKFKGWLVTISAFKEELSSIRQTEEYKHN